MSNFFTKFLEKQDIIDLSFKCVDTEGSLELIFVLYDDLSLPLPSNYELFKLLIKREQMNLFDKVLKTFSTSEGIQSSDNDVREAERILAKNFEYVS